ncbi:MAG: ABC transporter substrate-binding protein [Prochlorothrix sp.]|nr:ABC transporter substrate-binding protein [Prochlorothrix sp.]
MPKQSAPKQSVSKKPVPQQPVPQQPAQPTLDRAGRDGLSPLTQFSRIGIGSWLGLGQGQAGLPRAAGGAVSRRVTGHGAARIRRGLVTAIGLGLVGSCGGTGEPDPTVSPSGASGTGAGTSPARIVLGTTLRPRTLDPADAYEMSSLNVIFNLCDRLYSYDLDSTEILPQLATTDPEISADGLTYRIPLRDDVVFHDGTAFDAAAMAFSLERFMTQGGKPAFLLRDVVESVTATGDYEITIQLEQPFAAFHALLAFQGLCALSPTAYGENFGEAGNFQPDMLVGSGPYQLAEYSDDRIRLDLFPDYWGEAPANSGIDIQIYKDNSANLFNSFRTEQVDVAYLSLDAQQIQALQADAAVGQAQAIAAQGVAVAYMVLNHQQPPLDQPAVRQALALTIDRDLLADRALQGLGQPLYSLVPPQVFGSSPTFQPPAGETPAQRQAQAQTLLREAGFSAENPAVVQVWYPTSSPPRRLAAEVLKQSIAQNLEGLLQIEVQSVDAATGFSNIGKGIYPSFLLTWFPDFLDADNYIQPFLGCEIGSVVTGCTQGGAQTQGSGYWNEAVNRLIQQERQETDPTARAAIFAEIQSIAAQDLPFIPLWQEQDYAFAQPNVTGVTLTPSQTFPLWPIAKD